MTTYTTTQDGAWNTAATWGGSGYPNADDDIAVIGHKVTYDRGVSSTAFGNVTINNGGMLIFPVDSSWKIYFNATAILTINSGGEIRTGTTSAADYLGISYVGQIHFPQGSTVRTVFVLNDGGTINLWGADVYSPANRYAYLDSNWTTGNILYLEGDYTTKWRSGELFWIHDNADSYATNGYQVQADTYTIASIGSYDSGNDRTPITVTSANPNMSCYAVNSEGKKNKLILCSRNLEIGDAGTQLSVYNYNTYIERIKFNNNQTTNNDKIRFKNCMFFGWGLCCDGGYNFNGSDVSFVSNGYVINYGTNHTVTGDFVSNGYGISSGTNHTVTGDLTSSSISLTSATTLQCAILEDCTISGTDRRAIRIYENSGNFLPLISGETGWQTPNSNNDWIFQAIPNSYCNTSYAGRMPLSPLKPMACYAAAEEQTLTFKIYPLAYTTSLTQADVILEVKYLDTASGITRTTVYNTAQTYANDGWRDCSVTFTPAQAGIVYFQLYVTKYKSGATILIDPVWSLS